MIIDAPGHKEFLKNMITGAANAEAALLLQGKLIGQGSFGSVYLGIDLYDEEYGVTFNANAVFFGVAGTLTGLVILGKAYFIKVADAGSVFAYSKKLSGVKPWYNIRFFNVSKQ